MHILLVGGVGLGRAGAIGRGAIGLEFGVALVAIGRHVTVDNINIHPLGRVLRQSCPGGQPLWVGCALVPLDLLLNILKGC